MPKGRPRKPTPLHILNGTFREDRHGGAEPRPLAGAPKCPPHLSKDAKKVWKELLRVTDGTGVLTQADAIAVEVYCNAVVTYRQYLAQLNTFKPASVLDEETQTAIKQLNVIVRDAKDDLDRYGSKLGLNPVARAQLHIQVDAKPAGVMTRDRSKGPPPPTKSPSAV